MGTPHEANRSLKSVEVTVGSPLLPFCILISQGIRFWCWYNMGSVVPLPCVYTEQSSKNALLSVGNMFLKLPIRFAMWLNVRHVRHAKIFFLPNASNECHFICFGLPHRQFCHLELYHMSLSPTWRPLLVSFLSKSKSVVLQADVQ